MQRHRRPRAPRTRGPRSQRGFTLIELLVVITILGILAAIVIFAVKGIGDKGRTSAVAEDARTLRTAEETYCAQHTTYTDEPGLVAAGLLKAPDPTVTPYNSISLGTDDVCGTGAHSSYSLYDASAPTTIVADSVPVGSAPTDVAIDPTTNRIYVANGNDNTVSVIDGTDDSVDPTAIPVGANPTHIAVNPNNHKVYTSNSDGTVSVIDTAHGNAVTAVPFGDGAGEIAIDPVNDKVFVVSPNTQAVIIINGTTDTATTADFTAASQPGFAVDATTNTIYAYGRDADGNVGLLAIDGVTDHATAHDIGGAGISYLAVNPATHQIFITGEVNNGLPNCGAPGATPPCNSGTDVGTRSRTITVDERTFASTFIQEPAVFPQERQIAVNPNTDTAFTFGNGFGVGSIMRFDPTAGPDGAYTSQAAATQLKLRDVSAYTHVLAVNPNTNRVYFPRSDLASQATPPLGGILTLDGNTMAPVPGPSPIATGRNFVALAINPKTNKVYAVDQNDSTVAVLK